jgi:hypothetical protein
VTTGPRFFIYVFCMLCFLSGCSALPARIPLSGSESIIVKESFKELVGNQHQCENSLDADITVSLKSRLYSGTMNGYLQLKAPASLKLVGINPFGQPLVVLVSNGEHFKYALLGESLSYDGNVDSEAFRKYVPTGFEPSSSFYTITGKLSPGELRIISISDDKEGRGAWLELEDVDDNTRSLVLFDQEQLLIHQYLQLDSGGDVTMKVGYSGHFPGPCRLPASITISSSNYSGELMIRLKDWRPDRSSSAADFEFKLPLNFKRVILN